MSDFDPKTFLAETAPKGASKTEKPKASAEPFDAKAFLSETAPESKTDVIELYKKGGVGGVAKAIGEKAINTDWLSALKDTAIRGIHPEATDMTVANNPLLQAGPPLSPMAVPKTIGAIARAALAVGSKSVPIIAGEAADQTIEKTFGHNSSVGKAIGLGLAIGRRAKGK